MFQNKIEKDIEDILFDPQTSGGLLISVEKEKAPQLLKELEKSPTEYAIIGEVLEEGEFPLIVE